MPTVTSPAEAVHHPSPGYWRQSLYRLLDDPAARICLAYLGLLFVLALASPWLPMADPHAADMMARLKPIGTAGHWLGTDELGRDMLSRLVHGTRLSLFVGLTPVVIATTLGTLLGMTAGYYGGAVNSLIMRSTDVVFAFPSVLLAIAVAGVMGSGIANTLIALTIVFTPQVIRVAESITASVRGRDYVDAARVSGAGTWTILTRQVAGNVLGPVLVYASSLVSVSMILGAGLSFLGLGARPPEAEWGLMLNTLRTAIFVNPWVAALPGLMIFLTSLSFNRLSDSIARAMDSRR